MLPLFKTHYSVGRAILKPKQVLKLAQEEKLDTLTVVEDSFYGFREFNKITQEAKQKFVFGLRLPVVGESLEEKPSKLIFFAKNNEGVKEAKNLYTKTYTSEKGLLIFSAIKDQLENILVAVPFYDSYVYNNTFHFGMSVIDLDGVDHIFLEEDNQHPFDFQIKKVLRDMGVKTELAKSIYYENREDFEPFQMFKALCNRSQGKTPTFGNPNLEHFCSSEFCWESWKEIKNA